MKLVHIALVSYFEHFTQLCIALNKKLISIFHILETSNNKSLKLRNGYINSLNIYNLDTFVLIE